MPDHKTLYLLRRPIKDPGQSLLPAASPGTASGNLTLVLMEEARSSQPSFPGQVYVLQPATGDPIEVRSGKSISYRDLIALIEEHDRTIVL
ncbi:MAG: hypothetical protein K0S45_3714 [Nitrospira sp.]|jgi:hypothetical protein|nr:hypothetical protein [Nitrospira sp.]